MSKIKKIPISKLKPGMVIYEMDISWMQTPFRLHRRKVENEHEIFLLKHAGARIITIDIEKGIDISDDLLVEKNSKSSENTDKNSNSEAKTISINKELKTAKIIQNKIQQLVRKLNDNIKNGIPIQIKEVLPIINESLECIKRNDQALLTMIHMHRKDIRLDAHAFAVFSLVLPLALKTNCSKEQIETLGMAALLHDCGWSRLPINLFAKGKSYDVSEAKLVQQHTQLATQALIKSKGIPEDVIQLVGQHHERENGKGYPNKLTDEQLHPLHAHLQVADLYDEYIHGLEDQAGVLPVNALKILYEKSSIGWFPKELVSEMIRILGVYPISSVVKLSSEETGVVTEINRKLPLQPKVTLLLDAEQQIIESPVIIDLSLNEEQRFIENVLEPSVLPEHLIP